MHFFSIQDVKSESMFDKIEIKDEIKASEIVPKVSF